MKTLNGYKLLGITAALGLATFNPPSWSVEDGKSSQVTQIVEKDGHKYKVVIEKGHKKIRVFAPIAPAPKSNEMYVKIRSGNALLDRVRVGLVKTRKNEAEFQGNLNLSQQSTIGIQFEIELSKSAE
ncbi:MAG: hypothetical protein AABZ55_10760 [Bdellovibrionota bacterium]